MTDLVEITTTVEDEAAAVALARGAVAARAAACGSWHPVRSAYPWKGRIVEEDEYRITLKTTPGRADEAVAWLRRHHPYELPMILRRPAIATVEYGTWVGETLASDGGGAVGGAATGGAVGGTAGGGAAGGDPE